MNIVQIGCNDCDLLDSVKDFIIDHASTVELAILVDPNSKKIKNCISVYEGVDVNIELVNKAITTKDSDNLTLYFNPKETNGQHTSVNRQHLLDHNHPENEIESFISPAININKLFEEYDLEVIDRLYIDTEGYDIDILRSLDFNKFKVKYIQFESAHSDGAFSGLTPKLKSFKNELSRLGYVFADAPPGECIAYTA